MNKKFQKIVPFLVVVAIIVFVAIVIFFAKPKYEEYSAVKTKVAKNNIERQKLEETIKDLDAEKEAENQKFKELKPIYEAQNSAPSDNLAAFGTMFEDIIQKIQKNGLFIRSIEYDMRPAADPIYQLSSDYYNVCELKFFLVGTYSQAQDFFVDLNNNFNYLTYISKLNITAFNANTDYLLIDSSITLYSKKPNK